MYSIMSSANTDSFTSSFLIWMPFMSFSCLIALSRTSRTRLNRSGKNAHPHLAPDLRRKTFSYNLLSVILFVGLVYVSFIILRYIQFTLTSLRFVFLIIMNVKFCQMHSLHLLK